MTARLSLVIGTLAFSLISLQALICELAEAKASLPGSHPGGTAICSQRPDGINYAAMSNRRGGGTTDWNTDLRTAIDAALAVVADKPQPHTSVNQVRLSTLLLPRVSCIEGFWTPRLPGRVRNRRPQCP